jgi:hypothetical protein
VRDERRTAVNRQSCLREKKRRKLSGSDPLARAMDAIQLRNIILFFSILLAGGFLGVLYWAATPNAPALFRSGISPPPPPPTPPSPVAASTAATDEVPPSDLVVDYSGLSKAVKGKGGGGKGAKKKGAKGGVSSGKVGGGGGKAGGKGAGKNSGKLPGMLANKLAAKHVGKASSKVPDEYWMEGAPKGGKGGGGKGGGGKGKAGSVKAGSSKGRGKANKQHKKGEPEFAEV